MTGHSLAEKLMESHIYLAASLKKRKNMAFDFAAVRRSLRRFGL
jgi:hypothetical protein